MEFYGKSLSKSCLKKVSRAEIFALCPALAALQGKQGRAALSSDGLCSNYS